MKMPGGKDPWDLKQPFQDRAVAIAKTGGNALGEVQPEASLDDPSAPHFLLLHWRFLLASITRYSQTGAVLPSQGFLIERMLAPLPRDYDGEVVELGAGTGALTLRLMERCPRARLLTCEINPDLAGDLSARIVAAGYGGRVRVSLEPAQSLLVNLDKWGSKPPEYIFSGIPIGNLVKHRAVSLIAAIHRALAPGGLYVQFQYSLMDRRKVRARFSQMRTGFVLMNIPPAFVYYARK